MSLSRQRRAAEFSEQLVSVWAFLAMLTLVGPYPWLATVVAAAIAWHVLIVVRYWKALRRFREGAQAIARRVPGVVAVYHAGAGIERVVFVEGRLHDVDRQLVGEFQGELCELGAVQIAVAYAPDHEDRPVVPGAERIG